MAWPIKEKPESCVNADLRGDKNCVKCYGDQCVGGTWTGSQSCWEAGCIQLDIDRLSPGQKSLLNI